MPQISQLPAATTPLAGTEVLPVVQGTTTTKVAVSDVAALAPQGTVTTVSVATANGLAGTVANATTTPVVTLTTSVSGIVKGDGTALSVAVAGTDYQSPIGTISGIAKGAGANTLTAAVAGTDYLAPPSGTSILKANSGGALANAVAGTDYVAPSGALGTPSSGTLTNCTADGTNEVGFRNIPQNSQSTNYTCVLSDKGKHIYHPSTDANARTFTIPANSSVAYPIGTALTFINMTSQVVTIAITSDTMYLAGAGTTGSRSLAQYGEATALKIGTTTWLISGVGLT